MLSGTVCVATPAAEQAGPSGAFVAGQEGAARQQIFNRIAPVYDQVRHGPPLLGRLRTRHTTGQSRARIFREIRHTAHGEYETPQLAQGICRISQPLNLSSLLPANAIQVLHADPAPDRG